MKAARTRRLTDRETAIVSTLALKLRLLAAGQIARTWWPQTTTGVNRSKRVLKELTDSGWLGSALAPGRQLLRLEKPLICWRPGEPPPSFENLSKQAIGRLKALPLQKTRIYYASPRAVQALGGSSPGRLLGCDYVAHDLHVGELYLRLLAQEPEKAASWAGEDVFAAERKGQKLPDAMLRDEHDKPKLVMEFIGAYSSARLAALHEDCACRGLPYEFW